MICLTESELRPLGLMAACAEVDAQRRTVYFADILQLTDTEKSVVGLSLQFSI